MDLSAYAFDLPEALIALRPAEPQDAARLLVVHGDGRLEDAGVRDLPHYLAAGDTLVFNDTRVIPAALNGTRPARAVGGGGDVAVEVNLHKRVDASTWRAFVRPAKRLRVGDVIHFGELEAEITGKSEGGDTRLRFNRTGAALDQAIAATGVPPSGSRPRLWTGLADPHSSTLVPTVRRRSLIRTLRCPSAAPLGAPPRASSQLEEVVVVRGV